MNFRRFLKFKGKKVINRPYYSPDVSKIVLDGQNNIIDISNLVFEEKL